MAAKTVTETRVTVAQLTTPNDANHLGKVFGGSILSMIDLAAYTCATRFAEYVCVTASFDRVDFLHAIDVGELVTMHAFVSYVGRTSIEVTIEVIAEDPLQRSPRTTNTARVTMVALHDGRPVEVPRLICETRDDRIRFLIGRLRRDRRNVHRKEFEDIVRGFRAMDDLELERRVAEAG